MRWLYPFLIGLLFGFIQTGYFIRLSFALASTYGTFLMVTLAWLAGSIAGLKVNAIRKIPLFAGVLLCLVPYLLTLLIVNAYPYEGQWWPVYTLCIFLSGSFAGIFFAQLGGVIRPVRHLLFAENNGFLLGVTFLPILYLSFGQIVVWVLPAITAVFCLLRTPGTIMGSDSPVSTDPVHEGTSA